MAPPRARRLGKKSGANGSGPQPGGKDGREFVAEAEELLEQLGADLCLLHEQRDREREAEPELVNRLFRSAHTLKGLTNLFGQDEPSRVAHRLEDVLDALRLGRIDPRSPAVGLLDQGIAILLSLVSSAADPSDERSANGGRTDAFLAELERALAAAPDAGSPDLAAIGLDPALARALTEFEEHRLRENAARGRAIVLIDATFDLAGFEEGLAEISSAVRESGEIVSTLPSAAASGDGRICFSLLVGTDLDPELLARRLAPSHGTLRVVRPGRPGSGRPATEQEGERVESLRSISRSVRVDIGKLDLLMNLVGEMVSQRNALASLASRSSADPRSARIGAELTKIHKQIDRRLKELQAGVLDVRMVPMRQVFEKLSRVVRRLRVDLDREVVLDLTGGDTELDKLIVEQLVDPLVHIVRNALDHGLEPTAERVAVGKPPVGRIRVAAFQRGNHVVIEVADDGRGMDVQAIRARAISMGMLSEDDAISEREILNLVFEAGVSTRDAVSQTSGRGVGMDVVRSNLAALGGLVEVSSQGGIGTTLTITLPITLAIIQALIVRSAGERFAIPLSSVKETLRIEDHRVFRAEDRELLDLRGRPLPLRHLAEELELVGERRTDRGFVVVFGIGEQQLGVVVDALDGQQDVVIKPIRGPLRALRAIAGATELGDRVAVLVIDVSTLMADAMRRREAA